MTQAQLTPEPTHKELTDAEFVVSCIKWDLQRLYEAGEKLLRAMQNLEVLIEADQARDVEAQASR